MKGRISLTLRDKHPEDAGVYACRVTPGECNECVFQVIHSPVSKYNDFYYFSITFVKYKDIIKLILLI